MVRESGLSLEAAAPFVKHFRGRMFVVKISGALLEEPLALESLATQLALLDSLGISLVLVHGGGSQANKLADRLGVPQKQIAGRRITDDATLEIVTMAFAGARTQLLAALRRQGMSAVGLSGVDGRLTAAVKRPPVSVTDPGGDTRIVDFGHVGDIAAVHPEVLHDLLKAGHVPVVSPLAGDDQGRVYNINADTMAARLAGALGAAKVIFLTEVPGLLRDVSQPSTLISLLDIEECNELIATGVVKGGMLPKLAACRLALESGVARAHLVAGLVPHALLREILTNEGSGTLVVKSLQESDDPEPVETA